MSDGEGNAIRIANDADIIHARQSGRDLAKSLGMRISEATLVATAISELARNIIHHSEGPGSITLKVVSGRRGNGLEVIAADTGKGIENVERALQDGYSTQGSLGLGLPGVRRIADEFDVESKLGVGTTVRFVKWAK